MTEVALVAWAEEAKAAHMLATSLAKTSFAGSYKGKPEDATAAIMKGAEIGLTPLAALSSIHLIQGTPALSANALRAVVQAQGHEVWIVSSSDKKAIAKARRHGSDIEHTSTWTIERATAMGLTGKDNWRKQAEAMLIARATSEVCRLVASDAILGIAYAVEELEDTAPEAPKRTVQRRHRTELPGHEAVIEHAVAELEAAPEPTPDAEQQALDAAAAVVAGAGMAEMITRPQMQKMQAMFTEKGLTDRGARIRYTSDVIGREIATSADLTKAEAMDLIDALEKDK
jgi:hypothetical protein